MESQPTLFSLLTKLSPSERQKFGEARRAFKKTGEERLVQDKKGEWRLEYWKGKKKIADLPV